MKIYIVLAMAIALNALANILIKIGMLKIGQIGNVLEIFSRAILRPIIISGILSFALALIAYSYVLSKLNLSIAYPIMTSLGFLIVVFVSWIFLKETITLIQVLGFVLILSGVWMVAR